MSLIAEIDSVLEPYHSLHCQSRQGWFKGQTKPAPCNCSLLGARNTILETISKHLPEKRPRFGPQNENGDYAPEEYENGGYNEAIDQVNKLLTTNKKEEV